MNLVFVHGWGGDGRIWQPLIDVLSAGPEGGHQLGPYRSITALELPGFGGNSGRPWPGDEVLLRQLYGQLPQNCLLVGHSLGGMLAARLAALPGQEKPGQKKIAALVTIAANASFVQRGDWPGMNPQTFTAFRESMAGEPQATWEKFCGLQARGDGAMRAVLKQLKNWRPAEIGPQWRHALDCLGRLDNRDLLAAPEIPALHLFGEKDALVPATAAEKTRALGATAELLSGCGHVPQVSSPALVAEKIHRFAAGLRPASGVGTPRSRVPKSPVPSPQSPVPKSAVARSFGRAAAGYDAAAHLQRAVCRQLLAEADSVWAPQTILDLGSGTGYGSELLRQRFPQARIIALDLAEGMLRYARQRRPAADFHIAADAERLPLADGSIDLVFSSMALQWCYQLPQLFAELNRVLAGGGRCLLATLGPGTLRELKGSWARVDGGVHVNRFLPQGEWMGAAAESGLPGELRAEERVLHFDNVRQLMRELKTIGAHNVNRDAGRGLMSKAKLSGLERAYERLRTPAGLPASYEVIYLKLARVAGATENCTVGAAGRPSAGGRDRIIR